MTSPIDEAMSRATWRVQKEIDGSGSDAVTVWVQTGTRLHARAYIFGCADLMHPGAIAAALVRMNSELRIALEWHFAKNGEGDR